MRIRHHYFYLAKKGLISFLEKNNIPYELVNTPESIGKLCAFDLYEDQEAYWKFRKKYFFSQYDSIKTIEYSKQEIERAEWLTVRSKGTKVQWEYEEEAFRETCPYKRLFIKEPCYRHSEQVGILYAGKPVKWGTRQYFSGPDAADNLLFCSEKTKNLLDKQLENLEFWPVKKTNSKNNIPDLYQLLRLPIPKIGLVP